MQTQNDPALRVKEDQSPNLFMRNGRMIMKISATVLELTEAYCDHCAIRIQTIAPFATTLELAIDEHIGAGFLADEWHSTFQTGREKIGRASIGESVWQYV